MNASRSNEYLSYLGYRLYKISDGYNEYLKVGDDRQHCTKTDLLSLSNIFKLMCLADPTKDLDCLSKEAQCQVLLFAKNIADTKVPSTQSLTLVTPATPKLGSHTHIALDITDFDEAAQDAIGRILQDSDTIDFTYNDIYNIITAEVKQAAIKTSLITDDAGFATGGYTDEDAQDAVGSILTNTATVSFTYNDVANQITADINASGITITESQISDLNHTDPFAIHSNIASEFSALTEQVSPIGNDLLLIEDSTAAGIKKYIKISSLPTGVSSHSALTDLNNDDHPQYILGAGRPSGQTIIGGTQASETLILQSTSDVLKGRIITSDNLEVAKGITFDNNGAGADPLLSSNAASQLLSLTGDLSISGQLTVVTPISDANIASSSNWNTAFGWGNHATAGYLTAESDPVFSASPASGILAGDITNWNTAYGWGDHGAAGYLTSETNDLTASVTWANVPDANITASSVTQHEGSINHNNLLNFVANQHIDWTSATQNLSTLGTGTFADILTVEGSIPNPGRLRLLQQAGVGYIEIRSPASIPVNRLQTLQNVDGVIALVSDTISHSSPVLGGDLDVSTHSIISTGVNDVVIASANDVVINSLTWPLTDGSPNQVLTTDGFGNLTFTTPGGSGDMLKSVYDPAGINEQLVGLAATQTISNKTLTAPIINNGTVNGATIILQTAINPLPVNEGEIWWDQNDDRMVIGTGPSQVIFSDDSKLATAAQGILADSAMQDLTDDLTPSLGGNLDVGSNEILSTGASDITLHTAKNISIILGDTAGNNKIDIKDSANTIVSSVNSDGVATFNTLKLEAVSNQLVLDSLGNTTTITDSATGNRIITLPDETGTVVLTSTIADDILVRGNGGGASVQGSGISVSDSNAVGNITSLSGVNTASGNLTLISTDNATKGTVIIEQADSLYLNSGTSAMELRLREPSGSGSDYTGFKAQAMASSVIYTLPAATGSAGQVLTWNTGNILSWTTPAGGGGSFTLSDGTTSETISSGDTLTAHSDFFQVSATDTLNLVKRRVFWDVGAGAMNMAPSNSAQPGTGLHTDVAIDYFSFDGITKEYALFSVIPPDQFLIADQLKVRFYWRNVSGTSSEGVRWGIEYRIVGDNQVLDGAFTGAGEVTDNLTNTTANMYISDSATLDLSASGWVSPRMIIFRVYRDPVHAADTLVDDARLFKVAIQYSHSQKKATTWT